MRAEEGVVQRSCTGNFRQLGRIPAVSAEEWHRQSKLTRLFDDHTDFLIISGNKNYIGVGCFDFRNSGLKVVSREAIQQKVTQHVEAFLALMDDKYDVLSLVWSEVENVLQLTLERDVKSLSLHEVSLVVTLLSEALGPDLIVEKGPVADDEEMWFQNEMLIDGLQESMRRESPRQSLVGIREEGRVLVFNQWLKDGKIK